MTDLIYDKVPRFPRKRDCDLCYARLDGSSLTTLKETIAEGNYEVSGGRVAEKIVSTQLFLFTSCC